MNGMHERVAAKIERDPALLRIPLENIEHWLAQGISAPHRLEQWRAIILRAQGSADGMRELLRLLRDTGEEAVHLKSFDPFPGVLTPQERREVIRECVYAH